MRAVKERRQLLVPLSCMLLQTVEGTSVCMPKQVLYGIMLTLSCFTFIVLVYTHCRMLLKPLLFFNELNY